MSLQFVLSPTSRRKGEGPAAGGRPPRHAPGRQIATVGKRLPWFRPLVTAVLLFAATATAARAESEPLTVSLPHDRIAAPQGEPAGVVVLISDANGWNEEEEKALETARDKGAIAVGVDLRAYLAALAREVDRDCLFLVADIEKLSRHLHRRHAAAFYRPPIVTGLREGAALALAIAAQTPNASFAETIGATVAIDPTGAVRLPKPLCTPAPRRETADGAAYGMSPGTLPNPVRIAFGPTAGDAGKAHARSLAASHPGIVIAEQGHRTDVALFDTEVGAAVESLRPQGEALDLPLVEALAPARHDALAIFYSGDGGWRDIDQQITAHLNTAGMPVVGVDALRYFWSEKSPQETAADLSRIIAEYRRRLGVSRVILIGYSFGANILPRVYGLLPPEDRAAIDRLSLVALSHNADFEIAVTGWLGVSGAGKHGDPVDHLQSVEPGKIQCIYGLADAESACQALAPLAAAGAELIARPGGHHFDENYELLAEMILARIGQR